MANEFKIRKGLIVEGATGGTVVDVQGSLGQLFSVTDNLTGEIFAVADISGVPIMSINSNGKVGIGTTSPSRGDLVVNGDFRTTASGDGQLAIISKASGSNPSAADVGGQMVFGGPISTTDSNRTFGLVGGYKENATSGDRAGYLSFGTRQNTGTRDIFERMRIDSIGNVGIGTDSPSRDGLNVFHTSGPYVHLTNTTTGNTANDGGYLSMVGTELRLGNQESGGTLSLFTNNSTGNGITILSSGNVGIGTTGPDSKLNIEGTKTVALSTAADFLTFGLTVDDNNAFDTAGLGGGIAFRGKRNTGGVQTVYGAIDVLKESIAGDSYSGSMRFYTNQNSTGIPLERMVINSSGAIKFSSYNLTNNAGTPTYILGTDASGNVVKVLGADVPGSVSGSGSTNMVTKFTDGPNGVIGDSGISDASNALAITINGNEEVGIGGSPFYKLDVFGTARVSGTATFTGNVGIGVTGPTQALVVSDSNNYKGILVRGSVAPNIGFVQNAGSTPTWKAGLSGNDGSAFSISSGAAETDRLIIKSNGNVGIGTLTPNTKLDVNGVVVIAPNTDGKQTFEFTTNASNDARLLMKSDTTVKVDIQANGDSYFNGGDVGIGTTGPNANLQVQRDTSTPNIFNVLDVVASIGNNNSNPGNHYPSGIRVYQGNGTMGSGLAVMNIGVNTNSATTANGNSGIIETPVGMTQGIQISARDTSAFIRFNTGSSEKMRISSGGLINLSVYGAGYLKTDAAGNVTAAGASQVGPFLPLAGGDVTGAVITGSGLSNAAGLTLGGSNNNFRLLYNNTASYRGNHGWRQLQMGNNGGNDIIAGNTQAGGYLRFFVNNTNDCENISTPNGTLAMNIIANGNVGIGTTGPIDKLNVDGGTGDAAAQDAKIALTRISSTGNVLAGKMVLTTSPDTTNHGNLVFQVKTTASSAESSAYYTDAIAIDGRNANVGIGTSTPNARLDVQGTQGQLFSVTDDLSGEIFAVADISGVPIMTVNSSGVSYFDGKVGIGVAAGAYELNVSGNIKTVGLIVGSTTTPNEGGISLDSGDLTLGPAVSIALRDQPAASTASGNGIIVNWSVSEAVTAGTLYVVKTNGGWTTADADSETRATYMLAIALGTNATQGMLLQGFFYKSSHGFVIGAPLYISNTSGAFSNTKPTGSGDYVRIIGYATSANYIYLDPDKTWIKLT